MPQNSYSVSNRFGTFSSTDDPNQKYQSYLEQAKLIQRQQEALGAEAQGKINEYEAKLARYKDGLSQYERLQKYNSGNLAQQIQANKSKKELDSLKQEQARINLELSKINEQSEKLRAQNESAYQKYTNWITGYNASGVGSHETGYITMDGQRADYTKNNGSISYYFPNQALSIPKGDLIQVKPDYIPSIVAPGQTYYFSPNYSGTIPPKANTYPKADTTPTIPIKIEKPILTPNDQEYWQRKNQDDYYKGFRETIAQAEKSFIESGGGRGIYYVTKPFKEAYESGATQMDPFAKGQLEKAGGAIFFIPETTYNIIKDPASLPAGYIEVAKDPIGYTKELYTRGTTGSDFERGKAGAEVLMWAEGGRSLAKKGIKATKPYAEKIKEKAGKIKAELEERIAEERNYQQMKRQLDIEKAEGEIQQEMRDLKRKEAFDKEVSKRISPELNKEIEKQVKLEKERFKNWGNESIPERVDPRDMQTFDKVNTRGSRVPTKESILEKPDMGLPTREEFIRKKMEPKIQQLETAMLEGKMGEFEYKSRQWDLKRSLKQDYNEKRMFMEERAKRKREIAERRRAEARNQKETTNQKETAPKERESEGSKEEERRSGKRKKEMVNKEKLTGGHDPEAYKTLSAFEKKQLARLEELLEIDKRNEERGGIPRGNRTVLKTKIREIKSSLLRNRIKGKRTKGGTKRLLEKYDLRKYRNKRTISDYVTLSDTRRMSRIGDLKREKAALDSEASTLSRRIGKLAGSEKMKTRGLMTGQLSDQMYMQMEMQESDRATAEMTKQKEAEETKERTIAITEPNENKKPPIPKPDKRPSRDPNKEPTERKPKEKVETKDGDFKPPKIPTRKRAEKKGKTNKEEETTIGSFVPAIYSKKKGWQYVEDERYETKEEATQRAIEIAQETKETERAGTAPRRELPNRRRMESLRRTPRETRIRRLEHSTAAYKESGLYKPWKRTGSGRTLFKSLGAFR